jgi:hypothetical protein
MRTNFLKAIDEYLVFFGRPWLLTEIRCQIIHKAVPALPGTTAGHRICYHLPMGRAIALGKEDQFLILSRRESLAAAGNRVFRKALMTVGVVPKYRSGVL